MDVPAIQRQLSAFIVEQFLKEDGSALDSTLDEKTPLLEWGIVNSLTVLELVAFIRERFGLIIPGDELTAANFENVERLAGLLVRLEARSAEARSATAG